MAKYTTDDKEISSDDSDEENSDYLFIIRKLPKNTPPLPSILRNLDNPPPGAFYSTSPPIIRHGRVMKKILMKKVILNKWFWAHVKCYKF